MVFRLQTKTGKYVKNITLSQAQSYSTVSKMGKYDNLDPKGTKWGDELTKLL